MTTRKQTEANKANAQKSSGPKTTAGKSKSAQNAVIHGLTGRPDWSMVTTFYRIVLEDPNAEPDPFTQDPRLRAALALAEAMAGLRRADQAERDFLFSASAIALRKKGSLQEYLDVLAELDFEDMDTLDHFIARETDPSMKEVLKILKASSPKRPAEIKKTFKRLARYRREAASRRDKTLGHWVSHQTQHPETNPNSIKN